MGKIRVKQLGDDKTEKAQKAQAKVKREQKKLAKLAGKGGGRITDLSMEEVVTPKLEEVQVEKPKEKSKKAPRERGKKYKQNSAKVEKNKTYSPSEAVKLVKETSYSKFKGSFEVHINVKEKGLRGTVKLPHGTGKETRVVIATDATVSEIQAGKINFDILVAHPQMMPKLARVARILGPKGLMPNPKAGTISTDPEKMAKKLSGGQINWKTEAEAPIIHMVIGKVDFPASDIEENLNSLIKAINPARINSLFVKATMGPSVKVTFQ